MSATLTQRFFGWGVDPRIKIWALSPGHPQGGRSGPSPRPTGPGADSSARPLKIQGFPSATSEPLHATSGDLSQHGDGSLRDVSHLGILGRDLRTQGEATTIGIWGQWMPTFGKSQA